MFKKQLNKLEKSEQIRVILKLEEITKNPYSYVKKLVGNDFHRLRVGNLRIILEIKDNKLLIMVLKVDKRSRIYK
ncbi:MAG: type II toxin-antitoxin system RelE/ParE family toxin [Nanoarchaeales archaeon]|nr:type II toxin-antitoxin system RelE/ParE family toxin [Nanoarchaeales archaeon]